MLCCDLSMRQSSVLVLGLVVSMSADLGLESSSSSTIYDNNTISSITADSCFFCMQNFKVQQTQIVNIDNQLLLTRILSRFSAAPRTRLLA